MDIGSTGLSAMKAAGDIAKDVGKDKIANVLGNAFPFWGLRRRAVDAYIKDIENSNLPPETKMLMILNTKKTYKELQNQMAIAEIAHNTAKEGTDFTTGSKVDEEWLSRYMDAGKHVSDEEVQLLWGNILAGEFEEPGHTPPNVIRILSELSPRYAKLFQKLCSLQAVIFPSDQAGKPQRMNSMLIVPSGDAVQFLDNLGLTFEALSELSQFGLIQHEGLAPFVHTYRKDYSPILHILYGDDIVSCVDYPDREFPVGNVILTRAGACISRFIAKETIPGYFAVLSSYLDKKSGIALSKSPMISIWQEASETGTESSYHYKLINSPQTQEPH